MEPLNSHDSKPREQAFFRPADACFYLGVCRRKLHDLSENDPRFPIKIRLGPRCVGWRKSDLDAWLDIKARQSVAGSGSK